MNIISVNEWLQENESQFLPPVCNKMLHNDQLKVMFVGGPNEREDYHIEKGEELFYMLKGDMCLKTIEKGERRDVIIREGECFLLPGRIPHSPQRYEDTIGLVIERERIPSELDGLRYFIKDSITPLFERWFYCENLGEQLVPIINEFFSCEERVTQIPTKYSIPESEPYALNDTQSTDQPINVEQFLQENRSQIETSAKRMFSEDSKTDVWWYGPGTFEIFSNDHDTFLWQWRSKGSISSEGETKTFSVNNCILVPKNVIMSLVNENSDCVTLSVAMPVPKRLL
ncbi:3-hydroxyanthranilate 3,4-dioxygenase [Pseudolycoriella hygida]|uniref:3-hydroxyanthranilate 3,4-dioxygenase n=1 Tax=Pseudolycoriella hygida TaxID=35572 RepID=A0A9Q0MTA3_9DIPT|nr:3-hydroxyanthranilate 3,4-dioxygenase [Pseudolycoriella hygida]